MESITPITFLSKPSIDIKKMKYIEQSKNVYANLYQIKLSKELSVFQYPYSVSPNIAPGDSRIRSFLFKSCNKELKNTYGECLISGDSLYSLKKLLEVKAFKANIYLKGQRDEYILTFEKSVNERKIKNEEVQKDQLSKQIIELLVKDILHSNPKLDFYKGFFVLSTSKKTIETNGVSINFYPGFTTSFVETDRGNFLNVTLKNKIIQSETVYDYLVYYGYKDKEEQNNIKERLVGREFKVSYAKRHYFIDDILFDRNPDTQTFSFKGKNYKLIDYFKDEYKIVIHNPKQPIIVVRNKAKDGQVNNSYFVPELCYLSGLEDEETKNGLFMKELATLTKLEPNERIKKTNEFIKLLEDPSKDSNHPEKLSAKEKSDLYGIKVEPLNELFTAYYMKDTKLVGGSNTQVSSRDKTFKVLKKSDLTNWLCFYEENNYNDAENLYNTLSKASKAYGLKIPEPEWVEMKNKSSAKKWIDTADEYFSEDKHDYSFALFLLGKNDSIYAQLKKHSLCRNGYVSQVVKARSIQKKGGLMSVCSKILLQINAKLGGISYKAVIDKEINDRKLMVIGVDSSHIKGKRTGVAMVATINDSFTDFYNKEEIIKEENKEQLQFCISSFIEQAIVAYNKKNKNAPKGIVIYRQGVSLQQKEFLKTEIQQIDSVCKTKNILYYYILVNTKTTFKFFEKSNKGYSNPGSGLLVIDGVTNRNYFEFYIQPQEVTQGSATPTCFHVAYGNLNFPEMIPKFTYDLCHIYSNWQGTIRIPNVIKAAEKLSKMTAKYKLDELNPELKLGQAYL